MIARSLFIPSIRRRASALVAALCVVVAQAEHLLPDEHDGDAAVTQVAVGMENAQTPTAPADQSAPDSGHSIHVDHCAHAHVFASSAASAERDVFVSESNGPDTASLWLASITAPPHSRPPIA